MSGRLGDYDCDCYDRVTADVHARQSTITPELPLTFTSSLPPPLSATVMDALIGAAKRELDRHASQPAASVVGRVRRLLERHGKVLGGTVAESLAESAGRIEQILVREQGDIHSNCVTAHCLLHPITYTVQCQPFSHHPYSNVTPLPLSPPPPPSCPS